MLGRQKRQRRKQLLQQVGDLTSGLFGRLFELAGHPVQAVEHALGAHRRRACAPTQDPGAQRRIHGFAAQAGRTRPCGLRPFVQTNPCLVASTAASARLETLSFL